MMGYSLFSLKVFVARLAGSPPTYRFGKNEIKPAQKRATGVEEETGRMKN